MPYHQATIQIHIVRAAGRFTFVLPQCTCFLLKQNMTALPASTDTPSPSKKSRANRRTESENMSAIYADTPTPPQSPPPVTIGANG